MSRRIFLDVEEAISREVRRITSNDSRTLDRVILKENFDPFSGEIVSIPIEPSFYDSSADAGNIEYPHFFIRLMKAREDRFSNRVVSQDAFIYECPVEYAPGAYEIIVGGSDGQIAAPGNTLVTGIFQISKVEPGNFLKLLDGNNVGLYIVDTINKSAVGAHEIVVSDVLVESLSEFTFDSTTRTLQIPAPADLNTLQAGDTFQDNLGATFTILTVTADQGRFTIDGVADPSTAAGGTVTRSGSVFKNADLTNVRFLVLDQDQPIAASSTSSEQRVTQNILTGAQIPLDAFYLVRIDSKTKENHTDILNRMWEEFNPPRTALPTIVRSASSGEALLTADITAGGSDTLSIPAEDQSEFNVGDKVFIIDDLTPTKNTTGRGFARPFESTIIDKPSSTELQLADQIPDTFTTSNCAKIVSNAEFRAHMFHFVDHVTKDVEGSQYWVHEFTFYVQVWVERLGEGLETGVVTDIEGQLENNDGDDDDTNNIIFD